ncbi:PREDICTED: TAF5-like RNA polymerase II p300/CBP-associated factor-associated factor 65 kDa subunit 5L [Nicrophorus vespilloides]|uniref:TAF5-like RNA polymerase II p300/CBP-associated factor-associated factor 65 kDa subunit 5L n=1 Tax=Nicrophorus vespilloides TaxID=110193 RepID=A0ABM1MTL1_NICVS|nr:PREDICTED: TAF5-like RNA polymerase II p300/CBP-associated factor-associated factor 65 kDa subunit 5L [Nicrophorus vespilloides]
MEETRRDKVKKSKNDQISQIVATYLQKRNYPENIKPKEINENQMKLLMLVDSEVGRANSIAYTCYNSDPVIIDHSFSKFISWLKEVHNKSKEYQDLDSIVTPLFCHLYIELYHKTHKDKDVPINFFKLHLPTIEKFKCDYTLKSLINAVNSDSLDAVNLIKLFRSHRYYVNLSPRSSELLKKYLSENSHVVLIQILQTWFEINIEETEEGEGVDMEHKEYMNGYAPHNSSKHELLKTLNDAILALDKRPKSIFKLQLSNSKNDINSGLMDRQHGFYVYNYDSKIVVSSIQPLKRLEFSDSIGDIIFNEHGDIVYDFSYMRHSRMLLSASNDKTMKMFDLKTFRLVNTFKGHDYPVYKVASSPNGCYILTGSYDSSVRLWSPETAETLRLYAAHTQEITSLCFHPNSMYFASGSADRNIRMWTINDPTPVRLFLDSRGTVYTSQFSPGGKYLATAGVDKVIRIWDLIAGKQYLEIKAGNEIITHLCWGGNDEMLSSYSMDQVVKTWQINTIDNDDDEHKPWIIYNLPGRLLSMSYTFQTFGCLLASSPGPTYTENDHSMYM